jgi:hypothetical protein
MEEMRNVFVVLMRKSVGDTFDVVVVYERIILKLDLKKAWTELIWLTIWTSDGLL